MDYMAAVWFTWFMWMCVSYVVGALPTGYFIARFAGIADITQHGSGTMGATNVARTLGVPYFFMVFFIDAGKAAVTLSLLPHELWCAGIVMLVLGNILSVFMLFGGGKGVATLSGILAVLSAPLLFFSFCAWLCGLYYYRSVGCASVWALLIAMLAVWCTVTDVIFCAVVVLAALLSLYKHRRYVERMFLG